jgi:4-diphosphocytidyl-2-C-methyl-D-erythritol kinase
MEEIKIKCPAKINLDLRIINKRPDGFHNIESTMQTIDLFDFLTIKICENSVNTILLSGNSTEIPYDSKNLVYKAANLFLETFNSSKKYKIICEIEKNIPVSAGLAGGSTNAAGMIWGLNELLNRPFCEGKLHELCSTLGSDLNVCLKGGCLLTKGRGEILEPVEFKEFYVNLIKPINLGISAKEAYTKFSQKFQNKEDLNTRDEFKNDLEWAILQDYPTLQSIKNTYKTAIMTGSGSTYFSLAEEFKPQKGFWVSNNHKAISYGVCKVN